MQVGSVDQLWRYPVKSMVGERLDDALVRAGPESTEIARSR